MAYIGEIKTDQSGVSAGKAFAERMHQFADYKFQEMMKRNERARVEENYGNIPGISPEFARILANADPKERPTLMQIYPQLEQMKQQMAQGQSTSGPSQQPITAQPPQQSGIGLPTSGLPMNGFQNYMASRPDQSNVMPQVQPSGQGLTPAEVLARGYESPAIKFQREKEASKERRFGQTQDIAQEKLENLKRPYIDKIAESETKNKEAIRAYDRMEHLVKTDQVDDPATVTFLNMTGLENYPAFLKPGSQEYDAELLSFTSKIKDDFGARPTQWDAQQIFKRMATLLNTKEGKLRIIAANRNKLQAKNIINQQKREIIKENRGKIPADIGLRANERSEHKVDQLWDKYKQNLGIMEERYESLPNPSEYAGKIAEDDITGNRFISDGQKWTLQSSGVKE